MASTMASAKSCPCAMAAKGLRLVHARDLRSICSFCALDFIKLNVEPTVPDQRKGNGPRKDPRPLHHVPLHYAASFGT